MSDLSAFSDLAFSLALDTTKSVAVSKSSSVGLLGHLIFLIHFFLTIPLSPLLQFPASSLFSLCGCFWRHCAGYLPVASQSCTLTFRPMLPGLPVGKLSFPWTHLPAGLLLDLVSRRTRGRSESRSKKEAPSPGSYSAVVTHSCWRLLQQRWHMVILVSSRPGRGAPFPGTPALVNGGSNTEL